VYTSLQKTSDARDSVDGPTDGDQGIATAKASNLVPADANSLAFSHPTGQIITVVYLNPGRVKSGGFLPDGILLCRYHHLLLHPCGTVCLSRTVRG
jgi:hypothetical protein